MNVNYAERFEIHTRLKEVMGDHVADKMMDLMSPHDWNDVARKSDLADVVRQADIADMVRQADIADMVRQADIADMVRQADMVKVNHRIDLMAKDIRNMRWTLGVLVAAQIGMFGGLLTVMIQINNLR